MALTGRPGGPPLAPPGRAATIVRRALERLSLDLPDLLAERAALTGLRRNGPWSPGGRFRLLRAADGWIGLSLARSSDVELIPALVEESSARDDPWATLSAWALGVTAQAADDRMALLGFPGGAVPSPAPRRPGVRLTKLGRRSPRANPLIVDLTSLWAGPLCARLLGLRGARVVHVESSTRPDVGRRVTPAFFYRLRAGHDHVTLDFRTELGTLRDLIAKADLVLEASRPRALQQLGVLAEEAVTAGTSWLSITSRGRQSNSVGFGDDVAASAGVVVDDGDELLPVADALADPLAGVAAALAATDVLAGEDACLVDVSMLDVARESLDGWFAHPPHRVVKRGEEWWIETATDTFRVCEPTAGEVALS